MTNSAIFIDEAYAKSSMAGYRNLKTTIDYRNTDGTLIQYSLLCNKKAFDILIGKYKKLNSASFEYPETGENIQIMATRPKIHNFSFLKICRLAIFQCFFEFRIALSTYFSL